MVLPTIQCRNASNSLAVKAAVDGISACAPVDSGVAVTLSVCASENTIWLAFINQIKVAFCYIFGLLTTLQNEINSIHGMRTPGAANITVGGGAGTGATASIAGNDTAGQITLNTGTGSVSGLLATLAFLTPYTTAGILHLEAADANSTVALDGAAQPFTTCAVDGATLHIVGGVLNTSTTYLFNYVVLGGT